MKHLNWTDEEITAGVVSVFRDLSARPHGSCHEQEESDYLKGRLEALGGKVQQDALGNLLAEFSATPGKEALPVLCIQGHMDMVCVAAPEGDFCPETDPIQVVEKGEWITSDGTSSLGADNNLGNAAVLFLLEQGIAHGPLRVLLTVREEIGLEGAKVVPPEWLRGADYLLNTDGFQSEKMIVSSASGVRETWTKALTFRPATKPVLCRLALRGFPGGHSGFDIHKDRPNPILWMGELLAALGDRVELALLTGGVTHNAIPADCTAAVWCRSVEEVNAVAADWAMDHRNHDWPENATLTVQSDDQGEDWSADVSGRHLAWSEEDQRQVVETLNGFFHGVAAWHRDFPGVVLASANLGGVAQQEDRCVLSAFLRSAQPDWEETLFRRHRQAAEPNGFTCHATGYPGWPAARQNPLADALQQAAVAVTGQPLQVDAVHVGLEPSVLLAKNPGMVAVNYGPDIRDAHSVRERAWRITLPKYVRILAHTISNG